MLLSRDSILSCSDLLAEVVPVPEWGGSVRVLAMTGQERDRLEESMREEDRDGTVHVRTANMRAKLCAYTIVDAENKKLFTAADVAALGAKSSCALERVAAVAMRLSGMTKEDAEAIAKNSESGPSAAIT